MTGIDAVTLFMAILFVIALWTWHLTNPDREEGK